MIATSNWQYSPDAAILGCTLGVLLIFLEVNRPGIIVPGALGLLILLLSVAKLRDFYLSLTALGFLGVAVGLIIWNLRNATPWWFPVLPSAAMLTGFSRLVEGPGEQAVHFSAALTSAFLLGAGTTVLISIARRARINKGLD